MNANPNFRERVLKHRKTENIDIEQENLDVFDENKAPLAVVFKAARISTHFIRFITTRFEPNPTNLAFITAEWGEEDEKALSHIYEAIKNSTAISNEAKTRLPILMDSLLLRNFQKCRSASVHITINGTPAEGRSPLNISKLNKYLLTFAKKEDITQAGITTQNFIAELKGKSVSEAEIQCLEAYIENFQETLKNTFSILRQRKKEVQDLCNYLQTTLNVYHPNYEALKDALTSLASIDLDHLLEFEHYEPIFIYLAFIADEEAMKKFGLTKKNKKEAHSIIQTTKLYEYILQQKEVQDALALDPFLQACFFETIREFDISEDITIRINTGQRKEVQELFRTLKIGGQKLRGHIAWAEVKAPENMSYAVANSSVHGSNPVLSDFSRGQMIVPDEEYEANQNNYRTLLTNYTKKLSLVESNAKSYKDIEPGTYQIKDKTAGFGKNLKLYSYAIFDANNKPVSKEAFENMHPNKQAACKKVHAEFRIAPVSTYEQDKDNSKLAGHDNYAGQRTLKQNALIMNTGEGLNKTLLILDYCEEQQKREAHPKYKEIKKLSRSALHDLETFLQENNTMFLSTMTWKIQKIHELITNESSIPENSKSLLLEDWEHLKAYCASKIAGASSPQA